MNISENKRVVAISAVFALGFAGLCYAGYARTQQYKEATGKLKEISERYEEYEAAKYVPTKDTLAAFDEANKKLKSLNEGLQEDFKQYAKVCYGDGRQISSQDFQNELRAAIAAATKLASERRCRIAPPAADMGMRAFVNSAPVKDDVPYLSFQLKAIESVAQDIMSAGAPSLEKIYRAPLPEGKERNEAYFPLGFEVAFSAKRGVLPSVLNHIVSNKDYFLMITGISVMNQADIPGVDVYQAPTEAGGGGDDINADSAPESAPAPADGVRIATRKLGDPEETVRVHMCLEVLYFNPAKSVSNR